MIGGTPFPNLLSAIGSAQPGDVIDLGAGGGRLAGPMIERGHSVLAIDRDPEALLACAALGAQTRAGDLLDDIRARHRAGEISDADRALVEEWDAEIRAKAAIAFLRATQLLSSPELGGGRGGRRGGSRARDRGDEAQREGGDERPGRIADPAFHANFEPLVTAYLNDVEAKSGRKIPPKQRLWVKEALKNEAHWRKRGKEVNDAERIAFDRKKERLRKLWELMNGEKWPTYPDDYRVLDLQGKPLEAHHLILLSHGGPAREINLHPVGTAEHRFKDGIHRKDGPEKTLLKFLSEWSVKDAD